MSQAATRDNQVSLQAHTNYDPAAALASMRQLLAPLGGMEAFVKAGQKVLLKPNLLAGRAPEKAVTTHPQVVRAVITLVKECGGVISLGDSPGIGSPSNVARKAGLLDIVEETGISFAPFEDSVKIRPAGTTFHELEVARDLLEADVIINLPKLKTHQMMGLTCAVKNMFGAVVGLRKPKLHLQAGSDKAFFALMLLELCEQLTPTLTIVDAIVGMEGDGPGSGDPVQIGALLAGSAPLAIDTVATELVGMTTEQVWTQQVARNSGRKLTRIEELELLGSPLADLKVKSFRPSKMTDVNFGLKGSLRRYLTNALTARPVVDRSRCKLCNACVEHCPPAAMKIAERKLTIDYNQCIRCFCCQELCPHAALATKQGVLLRLNSLLHGRK